jgi:hypothetical protein
MSYVQKTAVILRSFEAIAGTDVSTFLQIILTVIQTFMSRYTCVQTVRETCLEGSGSSTKGNTAILLVSCMFAYKIQVR